MGIAGCMVICGWFSGNGITMIGFSVVPSQTQFTNGSLLLFQLGHEPIVPQASSNIFGRPVLIYPNVFKYSKFFSRILR